MTRSIQICQSGSMMNMEIGLKAFTTRTLLLTQVITV